MDRLKENGSLGAFQKMFLNSILVPEFVVEKMSGNPHTLPRCWKAYIEREWILYRQRQHLSLGFKLECAWMTSANKMNKIWFEEQPMNQFYFEQHPSEGMITYSLGGYLNENAILPVPVFAPTVRINLKNIEGLNSVGTRIWCDWIKKIQPPTVVRIENCPSIFVKCFNQVLGSLNSNMTVVSFYVPYYSPSKRKRVDILFTREHHFDPGGKVMANDNLSIEGEIYELDVNSDYFRFLSK